MQTMAIGKVVDESVIGNSSQTNTERTNDVSVSAALPAGKPSHALMIGVGAALVVSAGLLYAATLSAVMTGAYIGGLFVLLLGAVAAERFTKEAVSTEIATPDWTVTVAAIETKDGGLGEAIAITDRANRLVCANQNYLRPRAMKGPTVLARGSGSFFQSSILRL